MRGKTVTRTLSAEQAERYKPFFENSRRLKELVDQLEAFSVSIVSEAEGWALPAGASRDVGDAPENMSTTMGLGQ